MAYININYESKILGMPVMMNALIPQGRGEYQSLYLLHGAGGDYTTWLAKSKVAEYVENTNISVIMISGNNKCFVNNVHGKKYFQFLTEEVTETCTKWFGLSSKREDRYIAGMSMGGYGAVYAGLNRPDLYNSVFSYSGLLDVKLRYENPQGFNMYQIFGNREEFEKGNYDLLDCVKEDNVRRNVDNYPKFYIRCGLQDSIIDMSRRWHDAAEESGFTSDYYETAGGHDFIFWDKCIHETVEIITGESYRMEDIYGNNNEC